ncbi:NAD(P)/FAD-dependent oxidoreductase [Thalassobaculum sp.]|uniref:flavin-containing monooxygenase n=1 Tax=Thalassobaculum sp. TaxID=2022740 RepID=UPI0032EF86E3
MHAPLEVSPTRTVSDWLDGLNAAIRAGDPDRIGALFEADSHWRDALALTWTIATVSGRPEIQRRLAVSGVQCGIGNVAVDPDRCPPRIVERAGVATVEAILQFETDVGRGAGLVRIRSDRPAGATPQAWTLFTALEDLKGHEETAIQARRDEPAFAREFHGLNWLDRRQQSRAYEDRDPAVLIVGGGHAGLTAAARLGQLGVDTLVVDQEERIGDNWRLRYHGLKLHNQRHSNHLPYMPFPGTWPTYIPKDKIANWLETYAESMEINFWTRTSFEGAAFDRTSGHWAARLRLADGAIREIRPRHIIMATSVSGTPNIPAIPTLDRFGGAIVHSSGFRDGAEWQNRDVMVLGTGTSAHDIAQDLHGNGARVTMVQRSPTLVVNIEPSAQLYDGVYLGDGPSLEDRDLISASMPLPLVKAAHKRITDAVKEHDKPLLDGLEKVGFSLDFGEGGTGWPLKYRQRGGGYYFNVGCSELIAAGEIGLIQYSAITEFTEGGARLKDGGLRRAELIVLATGYKGQEHLVETLFGAEVAQRVGPIWGFDPATQELRNMWMRTRQPGLWFTASAFSQCRIYSKLLALQIKAAEIGLPMPPG